MRPARPGRAAFFTRVRAVSAALLQHCSTYGLPAVAGRFCRGRCRGAGMGSCSSRLPSPAAVVVARNLRDRLTVVASWTHAPRPGGAAHDVFRGPGRTALGRPPLLPSQPHQPGPAPGERAQLHRRLRAAGDRSVRRGDAGLARRHAVTPAGTLLVRAARLRCRQPGHPRAQGGHQGRLQPAPQDDPADDLGARAGRAARPADAVRRARSPGGLVRLRAERVAGVAGARLRGGGRAVGAAVLPARRPDRARVGGEDPHRSLPRREALSARAGAGAAR